MAVAAGPRRTGDTAGGGRFDRDVTVRAPAASVSGSMGSDATRRPPDAANDAWAAVGRLVAGPALYGGLGYLLDRWAQTAPIFLCLGVVVGFAAGIYLTIAAVDAAAKEADPLPRRRSTRVRRDPKGMSRGR